MSAGVPAAKPCAASCGRSAATWTLAGMPDSLLHAATAALTALVSASPEEPISRFTGLSVGVGSADDDPEAPEPESEKPPPPPQAVSARGRHMAAIRAPVVRAVLVMFFLFCRRLLRRAVGVCVGVVL